MSDAGWEEQVSKYNPDIVVHTAWQIREIYGNRPLSYKWNIDGSDRVFDFAFNTSSVKKLIHFSTVSSYGAFADNTIDHFYTESEKFRKTKYLYAEEKRWTEEHLEEKYAGLSAEVKNRIQVFLVRPAAITGPRGRVGRIRFGLQSALSGTLKGTSFVNNIVSLLTSFVPVTPKWLRQYIHEDDVTDIIAKLSFENVEPESAPVYEVFNISPPGACVLGPDMARAVGKKTLTIYPWMARLAFFFFWHVTRGRIPTAEGSWKGYSYPIAVDGSKLTKKYGYIYKYPSTEAFVKNEGRYAK
jgi:nucleoside-diphosphate-sugar epimerase